MNEWFLVYAKKEAEINPMLEVDLFVFVMGSYSKAEYSGPASALTYLSSKAS